MGALAKSWTLSPDSWSWRSSFNEAEALTETLYVVEPAEEDVIQVTRRKKKGKREANLKELPVEVISHTLPEEKLQEIFGSVGWKQLPDEVYK